MFAVPCDLDGHPGRMRSHDRFTQHYVADNSSVTDNSVEV
jgi:hypothetical protein